MHELSRILLEMDPVDTHSRTGRQGDRTARDERFVILRDLVGLREVGVEVVLPIELRLLIDGTAERVADADNVLDRGLVDRRGRSASRRTSSSGSSIRHALPSRWWEHMA